MMRSNGKFSSLKKEKRKEILRVNWFEKTVQIDEAGDCSAEDSDQVSWDQGRRVVELGFLASALFCYKCGEHLHLSDIEKEKRFGLASILNIKCRCCKTMCSIATGKRHSIDGSGAARCFDINTKLAAETDTRMPQCYSMEAGRNEEAVRTITVCQVNETHKMTPGKVTAARFHQLDRKRVDRYCRQSSQGAKKRRLDLKCERKGNQQFSENLEGISYQTGILTTEEMDENATEVVPEPLLLNSEECRLHGRSTILFDLETTGFGADANIIQLAALEIKSEKTFGSYVFPPGGIIPKAVTKLTNIEIHGKTMFYNCEYVPSIDTRTALVNFKKYLEPFGKSVLVAHNVLFDSEILFNSCKKFEVDLSSIDGFGDTLPLFQNEYPERKINHEGYKQMDLVKDILGIDYKAHSADEDVLALSKLVKTVDNFEEKIKTYSADEIKIRLERSENQKKYLNSYDELLARKILVKSKAEMLSSAGITTDHLKIINNRSGYDGLYILFRKLLSAPEKTATDVVKYLKELKDTNG